MIRPLNPEDIQVLILAGGFGTRLKSVVQDLPKPMATIANKPFLEYLISFLKAQNFKNITLLTGYKSELIQNYFQDGKNFGINMTYSHEDQPLGTGGALAQAMRSFPKSHYLVLNGDSFFSMKLCQLLINQDAMISIALRKVDDISRYGGVELDQNNKIISFYEKNQNGGPGLINAGIYLFKKEVLNYFPKQNNFSIEQDIFAKLAHQNLIFGVKSEGHFIDIGLPESFSEAQTLLPKWIQEYDQKI